MSTSFLSRINEFHSSASKKCGWGDFGADEYLQGLNEYCAALDANPEITDIGKLVIEQQIIGNLSGRLYSEHNKGLHPKYQQQEIQQPIFIIGLPRSGTTALHKLFAADPANQTLEYWLGQTPMPRPPKSSWHEFDEFGQCEDSLAMMAELAPDMLAIHEMAADGADECRLLLLQSFANVTMLSGSAVPSYESWLDHCDFQPIYQRYRENLQLIGLGNNARWVLKDPSHLWAPQTLLDTFPDACIVQMLRHPRELIPSVASLVYASNQMMAPERDKTSVGRRELKQWARVFNNLTTLRRQRPELNIYDVRIEQLRDDPVATVAGIYAHFGMEFSDTSKQAVTQYASTTKKEKHSLHQYSAEEFGLTDAMIDDAFADYIDYFEL